MGFFDFLTGRSPEGHEHRGDEYFQAGAFGDALMEYEKALDKIEKRFPEKGHLKERIADKMRSAGDNLAAAHLETVGAMAKAGEQDDARDLCRLALQLADDRRLREDIQARLDALDSGEGVLAGTAGYDDLPEDINDYDDYSQEYAQVEEIFSVLCNALPEDLREAYNGYGEAFMFGYAALNEGDFETAASELESAMDENQPDSLVPLELATAYIHLGRDEDAATLLESFVRQNPEQPRAYQLLCEIYWERKAYDQAGEILAGAPDSIKTSRALLLLAGENLFQQKKYTAAETVLNAYADRYGNDETVSRALAKTLEATGRTDEAKKLYAEILNSCMTCGRRADPFLKRRYAELCYQGGETSSKLVDIYLGLAREDPDNQPVYFKRVAEILAKQGEPEEARRYEALAKNALDRTT